MEPVSKSHWHYSFWLTPGTMQWTKSMLTKAGLPSCLVWPLNGLQGECSYVADSHLLTSSLSRHAALLCVGVIHARN